MALSVATITLRIGLCWSLGSEFWGSLLVAREDVDGRGGLGSPSSPIVSNIVSNIEDRGRPKS